MTTIPESDPILGWHFVALRDAVPTLADYGKTTDRDALTVAPGCVWTTDEPEICCCHSGLHSSRSAFYALQHAPGPIICRVASWGEVDEQADKLAARHREVLWMADATRELRLFACWCVRQVWHLLTDERSRRAVEVAERHALGHATDKELAVAWDAAWDAARALQRAEFEGRMLGLAP